MADAETGAVVAYRYLLPAGWWLGEFHGDRGVGGVVHLWRFGMIVSCYPKGWRGELRPSVEAILQIIGFELATFTSEALQSNLVNHTPPLQAISKAGPAMNRRSTRTAPCLPSWDRLQTHCKPVLEKLLWN